MTPDTPLRIPLAVDSVVQAGRLLTRWRREPMVPVQSLLFPSFLLITYKLLIGKSILILTGTDSLYGLVPMCAVVGAIFGALGAGLAIPAERESGLLSRLWVLPVHRSSALAGRLLAEAARTLGAAVVITALGVALGLRFEAGWLATIPFILVPVVVVIGFSTVVIAIAVRADGRTMVTWFGSGCVVLLFFNSGVAPVAVFPSWLQPAVRLQPMSPTIQAMRAFAEGGATLWPLLQTFAWVLGLILVFGPMAVRGYRVAAESGC
jgi:ABC-2 type transport system permease protein